jgi:O-glycosyl hydrolase
MTKKGTVLILLISLCLVIFLTSYVNKQLNEDSPVVTITINPNKKYQTIDGFGASDAWSTKFVGKNYPLKKREEMADLLFSQEFSEDGNPVGIGLSIWRFNLGGGSYEQAADSRIKDEWRREENFLDKDNSYDWSKCAGQQWFLKAANERGVENLLLFANSPLVQYTYNGKAFSPGGDTLNLPPKNYDAYAQYLVDVTQYFIDQGLQIAFLSPENEPQWDWKVDSQGWASQEGTPAGNAAIARFTRILSHKLEDAGLSTQIVLSEAGEINYLYESADSKRGCQIDAYFNPLSAHYVGNLPNVAHLICSHTYWSVFPMSKLVATRQSVANEIYRVDSTLRYWESEYCIIEPANEDLESGNGRDLSMKTALYVSRIIHKVLTSGNASTFQWWTAISKYDYKDGLIYLDDSANNEKSKNGINMYDGCFEKSKLLWALGNYSRFVRPGMVRVETLQSNCSNTQCYGIFSSSYLDEATGKLAIVLINYGDQERTISMKGNNTLMKSEFRAYVTSEEYNLSNIGEVRTKNIKLMLNSVTTLIGIIK